MKKAAFYDEAKRLFVQEGYSLDAIVAMLKQEVSRKTLYNWKTENNWEKQRKEFFNTKKNVQEDLMDVLQIVIKEAKADPSPHNIYALSKIVGTIKALQTAGLPDPDQTAQASEEVKPREITQETIDKIRDILGG